jgi:hypothetical protein
MVHRRANTLLQLQGIHRHHISERLDATLWHLFHADRWTSLILGLPYSIPDRLCDLYIQPAGATTLAVFHQRHLALPTGRVIDCLQSLEYPSLSAIAAIHEQIYVVTACFPARYLELADIATCQDLTETYTRTLRLISVRPKPHQSNYDCYQNPHSADWSNYATLPTNHAREAPSNTFSEGILPADLTWDYLGPYSAHGSLEPPPMSDCQAFAPQDNLTRMPYHGLEYDKDPFVVLATRETTIVCEQDKYRMTSYFLRSKRL